MEKINKEDLIRRSDAIDELDFSAELLRRTLDDTDVVGAERTKFEWGLGLIESCISDLKDLPSAEPEIVMCKDCRWGKKEDCEIIECFADINVPPEYHGYKWFCPNGERRTDERHSK